MTGTLKGFDQLMNLVMDDVVEEFESELHVSLVLAGVMVAVQYGGLERNTPEAADYREVRKLRLPRSCATRRTSC